jgi:hypothetical protein
MSVRHNLREHAVHVDRFQGIKKQICIPHHVLIYYVSLSNLSNSDDGFHAAGPQDVALARSKGHNEDCWNHLAGIEMKTVKGYFVCSPE